MKTVRLTVAQALIRFLDNQYVEFDGEQQKFVKGVFTIFGHGNVVGIGQALEENPGDLIMYQGRNEQGMAHIATGFAKQNHRRQIIACSASVGPGSANMVTAAATATANRIPLLLLPGDVFATRQPDPVLQQMEQPSDLSISTNDAFRAISKYWDRVTRPEQLMSAAISAMRVLTDPAETGTVTIALPQDVQGEAYDYPEHFFQRRVHRIERRPPVAAAIEAAAKRIQEGKKVMLICGGGVRYSEAAAEFQAFAEEFGIPFAETQAGKSAIPFDHYLNLGGVGTTGNLAANTIAHEVDLVIGVGTRYTDFTTASKWIYSNPDVKYVNLNICSFDAYKLDAVQVVGDAKESLIALREALKAEGWKSSYERSYIDTVRKQWADELQRLYSIKRDGDFIPEIPGDLDEELAEYAEVLGSELTQTRVLGILDAELDDDAIVVGAAGSLPGDLQRMWRPKQADTYHMEYGYSCMGYEIAATLGAKLARPDKEVYAFVGDGSYIMLHSELITSVQEGQKINVVLFDNIGFGCINNLQMENGSGSFGTEMRHRNPKTGKLDGSLVAIDFAKSAEAYGCKTYTVKSEQELVEALRDAKTQTVSTLIDVKVLPKTMSNGYLGWWRVGTAEVSRSESVQKAFKEMKENIDKARQY